MYVTIEPDDAIVGHVSVPGGARVEHPMVVVTPDGEITPKFKITFDGTPAEGAKLADEMIDALQKVRLQLLRSAASDEIYVAGLGMVPSVDIRTLGDVRRELDGQTAARNLPVDHLEGE